MEIWRYIKDYEWRYAVSSIGRVKSLKRTIVCKTRGGRFCTKYYKGRIMTLQESSRHGRYYEVRLSKFGISKAYSVHRLVAIAFVPNSDNKAQVNHMDGNTQNNLRTNLEWVTHKENIQHAFAMGLMNTGDRKGNNAHNRKLTQKKVDFMRLTYNGNRRMVKGFSKRYKVSESTISKAIYGTTWN